VNGPNGSDRIRVNQGAAGLAVTGLNAQVTLHNQEPSDALVVKGLDGNDDIAASLVAAAGAPPEALEPLMRRTIENGFEPTGPLVRGDLATIEAHREAVRRVRPELETLYDLLAEATAQ
jgi:predicted short-subunit dehydrogenase-like oxidoreductase (DUF2520 family)